MGHHYFLSFCRHCLPSPVMNSLTFSTRTRSRKRQKNMRRPDIREVRARSITSSGRDLGFRTFRGAQTKSGRGAADAGDIWSFLHSGSVYCQRGRPLLLPCTTNSSVALAKHSDSSALTQIYDYLLSLPLFLQNCAWEGRENSPFMLACQSVSTFLAELSRPYSRVSKNCSTVPLTQSELIA